MDASTYGRMVERGGYATGGIVQDPGFVLFGDGTPETRYELRGEPGPEIQFPTRGDYVSFPSRLLAAGFTPESVHGAVMLGDASLLRHSGVIHVQLEPPARNPDDGTAGVPAKV